MTAPTPAALDAIARVETIETVQLVGVDPTMPAEPYYRVLINDRCFDFGTEREAMNLRDAINEAASAQVETLTAGLAAERKAHAREYQARIATEMEQSAAVSARASAETALAEARYALTDLADFVEGKFEDETNEPCEREDWLCPNCEEFGCIRLKVERARSASPKPGSGV